MTLEEKDTAQSHTHSTSNKGITWLRVFLHLKQILHFLFVWKVGKQFVTIKKETSKESR